MVKQFKHSTSMRIVGILVGLLWPGLFLLFESNPSADSPDPRTQTKQTIPPSGFAGSEVCKDCHRTQYNAWRSSTHGRAGGLPGAETVIAPFDGTPFRFKDAVVIPQVTRDGRYIFAVQQHERDEKIFVVDGVIGGGHMVGGGTQGFVSRFPDGTVRFLPFDYSKDERRWFTNTITRANKGWVPITEELRLADSGDWPPSRILGNEARFSNCQECHGSQIEVRMNVQKKVYETHFNTLSINCESCHGPARRHSELARTGRLTEEIGLRPLTLLNKDESLMVCFQCHAVKDALKQGYQPGKDLLEYYSLKLPVLGDSHLHPDGRVKTFAYQENHLFSDCYLNGSMSCVSCHDPHGQHYRDIFKNPLPHRFDDRQCTGCHASKSENISLHTFHPPQSEGSRCVHCHMPYLQHPQIGTRVRFSRSDHSIAIPRPQFDHQLGIENACTKCHSTMSVDSLDRIVTAWYGPLKPHKPIISALVKARSLGSVQEAGELVLLPTARHPMAQAAGLALILERLPTPDSVALSGSSMDSLNALTLNDDPDVRALACAALLFMGEPAPKQKDESVCGRIVLGLGFLADRFLEGGEVEHAIKVYRKATAIDSTNARLYLNLGQALAARGDYQQAFDAYRKSFLLDPTQALTLVNLGIAYAAQGNTPRAIATYEQAMELNPHEPLAYFNLANIYLEANLPRRAIALYERAVELDLSLAPAHLYLARAYILTQQLEKALSSVRRALEFNPTNPSAQQMEHDLRRALKLE
jgi:tetratricopeptide (TPR) repeat protein